MIGKKKIFALMFLLAVTSVVYAVQNDGSVPVVGVSEPKVCCEKYNADLFCQDVKPGECPAGSRQPPTACESTSFCKPGYCYDSDDGLCWDNVAKVVCDEKGGEWTEEKPAGCNLGCCLLGDQASFVTQVMCKRVSGYYGIETNWLSEITDERLCVLMAGAHEKGACVYEEGPETTCKFTTRGECSGIAPGVEEKVVEEEAAEEPAEGGEEPQASPEGCDVLSDGKKFCPGKLCTDEALETNCAKTRETTCLDGNEEVYFVDTCGNPANVYDSSKVSNDDYWSEVVDKDESCKPGESNEDSKTCGNCNYLLGSYCREDTEGVNPTYGDNVCASLNCEYEGQKRIHGESWCAFDNPGQQDSGKNPVGSKFYRLSCVNSNVKVQPCDEFRQSECVENRAGGFSQAACRVNRWQDCTGQTKREDCENEVKRDCKWLQGIEYILMGRVLIPSGSGADGGPLDNSLGGIRQKAAEYIKEQGGIPEGACVPQNPPGLDFWTANAAPAGETGGAGKGGMTEAESVCGQANAICPVTYKKDLINGEWECEENCECLSPLTEMKRAEVCMAMGDCGPNVNIVGARGSGVGYEITEEDLDDED